MKKRLLCKILPTCSLLFFLTACTSLDYIEENTNEVIKTSNIETDEAFTLRAVEKTLGEQSFKVGISETVLDNALVLYFEVKNNSDVMYKFDINDIKVTSPIGEVSFVSPANYIDAYQNFEAQNYIGLTSAGTALGQFASLQNQQYNRTQGPNTKTNLENLKLSPELQQLEKNIRGIQNHTIMSYTFLEAGADEYFYIFLRKPEELPIEVKYKGLTYKFGGKKNVQN